MAEGERASGRRASLHAWLVVGLAVWVQVGVLLVTRADMLGLVDDISLSPYHVVGYAALAVLAAYVLWAAGRALRRGDWRTAFPPLYGGLGLALVLLLGWVILDPIWRGTLGISPGIENGLAPPRLLIPAALALLAIGPVREAIAARAKPGPSRGELPLRWAGTAGIGLLGGALTISAFNPVTQPFNDYTVNPGVDNSEVWSMAPDGSGQTRLLAAVGDGVDFSLPAWSPDGSRIAYTVWTNEGGVPRNFLIEDQTSTIWSMAADGTDRRLVVDGAPDQAWIPSWSPDGEWIAYTRSPNVDSPAAAGEPEPGNVPGVIGPPLRTAGSSIWLVRPDGSDERRLSPENADALGAVWSPDGASIAFLVTGPGGTSDIHVAAVSDGALSGEFSVASDSANDWGPAWSPDGATLAFTSNRSGQDEIWLADLTSDPPGLRQLTDDRAGDWVPAFSPDGTRVAFVSDRTGDPEVWSMAIDGNDLRNLSNNRFGADGQWSVAWSPDGSRLAYAAAAYQDASSSGWVREDLAAAQALIFGLVLAVMALLLVALGASAGSFAVALTIVVALGAIPSDQWRFIPAAIVAGGATDVLIPLVRSRHRARVAAAALPSLANLALGVTIGVGETLFWSVTLLLGVTIASALLGLGLAIAAERLFPRASSIPDPEVLAPA